MYRWACLFHFTFLLFISAVCSCGSKGQQGPCIECISKNRIRSTMEFLSHDLLEGRAPGTRGGMLAEQYMKSIFKLLDIQPYGKRYFQPFDLKGYRAGDLSVEAGSA
jgi:hypothetical protein